MITITKRFYKDERNNWWIDMPEWPGDPMELQMVLGADNLLDIMSEGNPEIQMTFSNESFPFSNELVWVSDTIDGVIDAGGAVYHVSSIAGVEMNLDVWLCDVVKFIFGGIPKKIYFY